MRQNIAASFQEMVCDNVVSDDAIMLSLRSDAIILGINFLFSLVT